MADTFAPDYAVHPGETLKESLESSGMTQQELADRTGLHRKTINGIINGKEPLTHDTALQLERVFRVPARFWVNLQVNYDETLSRLNERARLMKQRDWITERAIPYGELAKRRLVPKTTDRMARLEATLSFFGVASPEAFDVVHQRSLQACAFRKSDKSRNAFGAIAAWLREGELASERISCSPFDKQGLGDALSEIRALSTDRTKDVMDSLVRCLAGVGVALVFVPGHRGAPIYGAARRLSPRKVIVQLSLRGRDDGNFWFTLFHEIGHVLLHDKGAIFLELDGRTSTREEEEANEFARNILVPPDALDAFVKGRERFSKNAITTFASEICVPPGVVVGRLQRDGWIPHSYCNDLKRRIESSPAQ